MLDFFKALFKPAPSSGETAKERLRLVLLSDHLSLAPDVIESLKRDLLAVISRYVEIDSAHADVTFEQRDREVAMLASIPITAVRDRPKPSSDFLFSLEPPPRSPLPPNVPEAQALPEAPTPAEGAPEDEPVVPLEAVDARGEESPDAGVEPAAEPAPENGPELAIAVATAPKPKPARSGNGAGSRRRRRKKYAAAAVAKAKHAQPHQLGGQASAQG